MCVTLRILISTSELTPSSLLPLLRLPVHPFLWCSPSLSVAAFRVLSALLFLAGSQTAPGARWQLLKALLSAAGGGVGGRTRGERERKEESAVGKGGNGTGDENRNGATRRVHPTAENLRCHGTQVPPHWWGLWYWTSPVKKAVYFNGMNVLMCMIMMISRRSSAVCSGVCSGVFLGPCEHAKLAFLPFTI